ncbi:hypothetical protein NQ317_004709 [Molorchus minor]|uniref:Uncharacterized protein n=1 Tax=Molorchus minor TaxID=1323400 RepID=A0ABQ9J7M7_9CUCU|nr:hypothetical protein NQ317_004709 [Molorchus minor]
MVQILTNIGIGEIGICKFWKGALSGVREIMGLFTYGLKKVAMSVKGLFSYLHYHSNNGMELDNTNDYLSPYCHTQTGIHYLIVSVVLAYVVEPDSYGIIKSVTGTGTRVPTNVQNVVTHNYLSMSIWKRVLVKK